MTLQGKETPYKFDATKSLIWQLAQQAKASGQMIMVVVADDDAYLEGRVTAVADDRFSMAIFNKFNYTDVRALQVDFSDILVMEFHGLDLEAGNRASPQARSITPRPDQAVSKRRST